VLPGCAGSIVTGAAGELLCMQADLVTPASWVEVSSYPSVEDSATAFGFGMGAVLTIWLISKAFGSVLQAIKRW